MSLSVKLLGPLAVEVDGSPLAVDTRKALALVAILAAADEPQPRRSLAAMLWPETDDEHAFGALRRTLSVLRSALGDRWVVPRNGVVALDGPELEVDVDRERAAWRRLDDDQGRHEPDAPCSRCLEALETIAGLHRGPFLAGFALRDSAEFDDWQATVARDAERRLATALERLSVAYAAAGRLSDAIAAAGRRLSLDPLDESAHRELMRLHAAAGDRSAAVRCYRDCARLLDQELSVEPLPETTALYRQILAGTPAAPDAAAARPAAATRAAATQELAPTTRLPLVGRDDALATLTAAWRGSAGRRVVVLEGEPGIGKTRLAEELAAAVEDSRGPSTHVDCFPEDAGVPYAVGIQLLRRLARSAPDRFAGLPAPVRSEVARLIPDLVGANRADSAAGTDDAARARFIEALVATTVTLIEPDRHAAPALLVVDDAQWLDAPTADLLVRVGRRLASARVLLLFCRRPVAPDGDVLGPLLRTGGAAAIRLERLDRRQVAELSRQAGLPDSSADGLYEASEGVPFYIVERLAATAGVTPSRAGAPSGAVAPHAAQATIDVMAGLRPAPEASLPVAVRLLVEARFAALSEPARQVLGTAAVVGRSFPAGLVRQVSGRSEDETVAALEELVAAGIVRERADGDGATYDFDHPRTRDAAYARLGVARRRLLHARAALALRRGGATVGAAGAGGPNGGVNAAAIARHYLAAGEDAEAAALLVESGREAERVFANDEAIALYSTALALDARLAGVLRERIAGLATLLGRYEEAIRNLEAALATSSGDRAGADAGAADLARLEQKLGSVHARRGEWLLAETHLASALERLPESAAEDRARVLLEQAVVAHRRGDGARAAPLAQRALQLAEEAGSGDVLAEAHNVCGMLAKRRGDLGAAERHLRRSLELAGGPTALHARAAALNNLALVEGAAGRPESAVELTEAALRIAVQVGDRHREAALRNNLADLLHAAGRVAQAREQVRESVAILADLGDARELNPELWRLVEW